MTHVLTKEVSAGALSQHQKLTRLCDRPWLCPPHTTMPSWPQHLSRLPHIQANTYAAQSVAPHISQSLRDLDLGLDSPKLKNLPFPWRQACAPWEEGSRAAPIPCSSKSQGVSGEAQPLVGTCVEQMQAPSLTLPGTEGSGAGTVYTKATLPVTLDRHSINRRCKTASSPFNLQFPSNSKLS